MKTVVIGIDSSASMTFEKELKQNVANQITEALKENKLVHLIIGNERIDFHTTFKPLDTVSLNWEMIQSSIRVSGGSDMDFISDFAKKEKAQKVLLHTDGMLMKAYKKGNIETQVFLYGKDCVKVPRCENFKVSMETVEVLVTSPI